MSAESPIGTRKLTAGGRNLSTESGRSGKYHNRDEGNFGSLPGSGSKFFNRDQESFDSATSRGNLDSKKLSSRGNSTIGKNGNGSSSQLSLIRPSPSELSQEFYDDEVDDFFSKQVKPKLLKF